MDSQTLPPEFSLGFVGAGKLAGSVIRGLVVAGFCPPSRIVASEPNADLRNALAKETGISASEKNTDAARAEIVFVGVKPSVVLPVLRELGSDIADKVVISLAAGVRIDAMEKVTKARVMRALTNTPSAICRAATALARGNRSTNED